jgi:hypothetical protein
MGEGARPGVVGIRDGASPARSARTACCALVALAVSLLALLVAGAPSFALIHRGHSFETSLETSGENKLSSPSAIATNERATGSGAGDTYVVDKGNNRVVRFGPSHEFLEAWGFGVLDGKAEYERCSEAAACKPGLAGFKPDQFSTPTGIAVDSSSSSPSAGDVYVVANRSGKKLVIDKFNFEGQPIGALIQKKEEKEEIEGAIAGVAVDASGKVWVEREDEETEFAIERFTNAVANTQLGEIVEFEVPEVTAEARPVRPGFALDASGRGYITFELGGVYAEEEEEELKEKEIPTLREPCVSHRCAVAQIQFTEPGGVLEAETVVGELSSQNTTGVAVDQSVGGLSSGDVYLDLATTVQALTPAGQLIQEFGAGQLGDGGGSGLAVNGRTNQVFVADATADKVDVYEPAKAGPPSVAAGSLAVSAVTSTSAGVSAAIDANGIDTHYVFRYGTSACLGNLAACTGEAPVPSGDLGAGFGNRSASAQLAGLSPGTTYHAIVLATNSKGEEAASPEEVTFKTPVSSALEAALPDGRNWELVSPPNKRGVAVEPIAHEGGLIQSAANGKSLAYVSSSPIGGEGPEEGPPGQRAPELTQLVGARTSPGDWSLHNITTPNEIAQGIPPNSRREYQFFSSDLSEAFVLPIEPLASSQVIGALPGGFSIYNRNTSCVTAPCYAPIFSGAASIGALQIGGATKDLQHAVIVANESTGTKLFEWSHEETSPGSGQHLTLVSVLPGSGEAASGTVGLGRPGLTNFEGARNAITQDGSRVVWARSTGAEQHLFVSTVAGGSAHSVQIDKPNNGVTVGPIKPFPVYQTSSASGDKVFFTDNQRLTTETSPENEFTDDLYVFEAGKPEGEQITDLTPDLNAGEEAAVQGGAIGASSDGSYVYFVANGALAEGAKAGKCVLSGVRSSTCSLYVAHYDGEEWERPHFIATLSNEDGPDWAPSSQQSTGYRLVEMTARVSPNGRYLSFMSNRRLTGYNNTDANSGAADEEVFLYDVSGEGHLSCASCNPSGAQPVGVHDVQESGEGRGLLVDRPGIWSTESEDSHFDNWLAASIPGWTPLDSEESFYQSRYLSDEGRLFFNSADSLVKQDVNNGKEDVYEYEPLGIGNCTSENVTGGCVALISSGRSEQESAFLDASETGDSVFFLTSAVLSAKDPDKAFDIYDARVCSGAGAEEGCPAPASPPAPPCQGEECRAGVSAQPTLGFSASSGSGNLSQQGAVLGTKQVQKAKPLTRAQKLTAALKACKKKYAKQKKKRASCEKLAKKKYGAKKKAKKSSAKRRSAHTSSRTRG